jgi:beta-lactam-binding protein with PASTA domain
MNEHLIMTVWDLFRDYIPEKNREMAATQYVDFLLGNDIEADTLHTYTGYDPHIDEAIKAVLEEEGLDDEEEDSFDEDEDY